MKPLKSLLFLCVLFLVECGVKGDPLPPLEPPALGRGKPSFRRATKKLPYEHLKPGEQTLEKEDDDDDETEELEETYPLEE